MKKILITRRLLRACENKAEEIFEANLNLNDEIYSQQKLLELSQGCDGILSSLTDKLDAETINKLPDSIKIISNFLPLLVAIHSISSVQRTLDTKLLLLPSLVKLSISSICKPDGSTSVKLILAFAAGATVKFTVLFL